MYTQKRSLCFLLSLLLCLSMLSGMAAFADEECTHEHTTQTEVTYSTICADGEEGHHTTYETRIRTTCLDCDYVDSGTLADVQPTPGPVEAHQFEDGVCVVCKYETKDDSEVSCTHPNIRLWDAGTRPYNCTPNVDGTTHSGMQFQLQGQYCPDCNYLDYVEIGDPYPLENEPHEWEWLDSESKCWVCDYSNPCPHTNIQVKDDVIDRLDCVPNEDGTTHTTTCLKTEYRICADCGSELGFDEVGEPYTIIESHVYGDNYYGTNDDLDDSCIYCGQQNPCNHDNLDYIDTDEYFDEGRIDMVAVDEKVHFGSYRIRERWQCADCGLYIYKTIAEVRKEKPHVWCDAGYCDVCGYENPCQHLNTEVSSTETILKCIERNESTHKLQVVLQNEEICLDCGLCRNIDIGNEPYEVEVSHQWSKNECTVCGFSNPCQHSNQYSESTPIQRTISVLDKDEYGHRVLEGAYVYHYCPDCDFSWYDSVSNEFTERYVAHDWNMKEDCKICSTCDYINLCEHPNMQTETYPSDSETEIQSSDDKTHTVTVKYEIHKFCPDCGYQDWFWSDDVYVRENEPHIYYMSNSTCSLCGYENTCSHENYEIVSVFDDPDAFIFEKVTSTETEHTIENVELKEQIQCLDCGAETERYTGKLHDVTGPHTWSSRECTICHYPNLCKHENVKESTSILEGAVVSSDKNGHTCKAISVLSKDCEDCGANLLTTRTLLDTTETFPHTINADGNTSTICRVCSYDQRTEQPVVTSAPIATEQPVVPTAVPSAAPTAVPTETPTVEPTAAPTEAPTAEPTAAPTEAPTEEPTIAPTEVPTEEPTTAPTAVPTEEPTAAPTKKPAATTPTPVPMPTVEPLEPIRVEYTDVPVAETVHGVSAAAPLRMGETLITAIEQIERESAGNPVSIEIVNAEKILNAKEKTALDALPVQEQILVLLSAIGYESEVQAALDSTDTTLSPEAVALTDAIQARIANATDEEKAAFEATLLDCFPVESVIIDGEAVDYFVIELQVEGNGETRFERYGFRFDEDGKWVFARLSVGKIAE